jgi:DNA-binding transcriptional MerR regulator/methylmalonyl-CoA mutase cobalamin-binding subunit
MYTIKQAAVRSGVNVALLRAWERRYGIVAPSRTDAGYRLYDDEAIERLRAMRTLVDEGWSASQAAARVAAAGPDELDGISAGATESEADAQDTTAAFVHSAVRIDGEGLERSLDDMFARGSFERIVEDRLYPALHALGDAWQAGEVDVAGEHAASSAALRRLAMAFEAAGGSGGDRPVLVGLPPGARHEIASLAFATAARRSGIPVVYLGPDVPAASWVAATERTDARAIAMGIVREEDVAGGNAVVAALRASHPTVVIAIGGRRGPLVGIGGVVQLPDGLDDAVTALRDALS